MKKKSKKRLEELENQAKKDMDYLHYPKRDWVIPKIYNGSKIVDVLIIGGGQNGISLAFSLKLEGVNNILVVDKSSENKEGPWLNFARMKSLRSPKYIIGPESSIKSLSVKAWWEASYNKKSWKKLNKIPKNDWFRYIQWLTKMVDIKTKNCMNVIDIVPITDSIIKILIENLITKENEIILARNVVMANGIEGCGSWYEPELYTKNIPLFSYSHSSEVINFNDLKGKKIAIIGGGASAFDNAAEALKHAAASVGIIIRRPKIPEVNPNKWMEFSGFLRHYCELDDELKLKFMTQIFQMSQPPTQDSYNRCLAYDNFSYKTGCEVKNVVFEKNKIVLYTEKCRKSFDYLILATGFVIDIKKRPELSSLQCVIATWQDKHNLSPQTKYGFEGYPYLSKSFQFTEKIPGTAPYLRRIYCYNFGSMLSLAANSSITVLKFGIERICHGITKELFLECSNNYYNELIEYEHIEFKEKK